MRPLFMIRLTPVALAVSLVATAATAAEKVVSGPQAGEEVTGFFDFGGVKCGGEPGGDAVGAKLRYY